MLENKTFSYFTQSRETKKPECRRAWPVLLEQLKFSSTSFCLLPAIAMASYSSALSIVHWNKR